MRGGSITFPLPLIEVHLVTSLVIDYFTDPRSFVDISVSSVYDKLLILVSDLSHSNYPCGRTQFVHSRIECHRK